MTDTNSEPMWRDRNGDVWHQLPSGGWSAVCALSDVYDALNGLIADVGPLTPMDANSVEAFRASLRFV
jgi:hypothetical protein